MTGTGSWTEVPKLDLELGFGSTPANPKPLPARVKSPVKSEGLDSTEAGCLRVFSSLYQMREPAWR